MFRNLRVRAAHVPTAWPWSISIVVATVVVVIHSGVDRIVEWDEGVFFSQSGGYRGVSGPPMYVSPSREGGPIGLIWAIRQMDLDLHGVRIIWVLIVVAGAAVAFWLLSRTVGRLYGVLGLVAYFSFWLTWVYAGVLHGPMLAGIAGLVALAAYEMSVRSVGRSANLLTGFFLGAAVATMFWFRPIESTVVAGTVVAISAVFDLREFWRQRPIAWLTAAATYIIGFAVPWSIWSTRYFGSVAARIEGWKAQAATGPQVGIRWGIPEWSEMLTGHRRSYGSFANMPSWSDIVVICGVLLVLVAAVATVVLGIVQWRRGEVMSARVRLMSASVFFATAGAYVFLLSNVRERYASLLWAYASWIVALALGDFMSRSRSRSISVGVRRAFLGIGVLGLAIWFIAQASIAPAYQRGLYDDELAHARTADYVTPLVQSGSCAAGVQYNLPLYQILTGCKLFQIRGIDSISEIAAVIEERGRSGYIFWIGDEVDIDLGKGWFAPEGANLGDARTLWVYDDPSNS